MSGRGWKPATAARPHGFRTIMDEQFALKIAEAESPDTDSHLHSELEWTIMDEQFALKIAEAESPDTDSHLRSEPLECEAFEEDQLSHSDADLALAMALQEEEYASRKPLPSGTEKMKFAWKGDVGAGASSYIPSHEAEEEQQQDEERSWRLNCTNTNPNPSRNPSHNPSHNTNPARPSGDTARRSDGSVVSKHDLQANARMNAIELSRFEGAGELEQGFSVPNRVFNSLKQSLTQTQGTRVSKDVYLQANESTTHTGVATNMDMDSAVQILLRKLIARRVLNCVGVVVGAGKEASIYHAHGGPDNWGGKVHGDESVPHDVAVKVFHTNPKGFANRREYFDEDSRYSNKKLNRQGKKQFQLWAEKEFRNLVRAQENGVRVPRPLLQRQHLLLMEFIGEDPHIDAQTPVPSPQLREVALDDASWDKCYGQVLAQVYLIFHRAQLVHTDLSEYNILYQNNSPVIIDWAQAVDRFHPSHMRYMENDLRNIGVFFQSRGVRVMQLGASLELLTSSSMQQMDGLTPHQAEEWIVRDVLRRVQDVGDVEAEISPNVLGTNTREYREYLRTFHAESDSRLDQLQHVGEVCTSVERDLYTQGLVHDSTCASPETSKVNANPTCEPCSSPAQHLFWSCMWEESKIPEEQCPIKHTPVGPQFQVQVDDEPSDLHTETHTFTSTHTYTV